MPFCVRGIERAKVREGISMAKSTTNFILIKAGVVERQITLGTDRLDKLDVKISAW